MSFFQESIIKAEALGRPAPKLITMVHESVALNAAIGVSMVTGEPAAVTVHVDVGRCTTAPPCTRPGVAGTP